MLRYLTPSALADVRDQAAERLQRRRPRNAARVRRPAPGQVVGYRRARSGAPGHVLRIRTQQGEERGVSAARVRVVPVPCQGHGQRWTQKL